MGEHAQSLAVDYDSDSFKGIAVSLLNLAKCESVQKDGGGNVSEIWRVWSLRKVTASKTLS